MTRDAQDLPLSGAAPETRAAIDRFVAEALSYGADLPCILPAVEAEPDCVMAQILAASLMMWAERGDSPALAAPHLTAAEALADRANDRERLWLTATRAWVDGDLERAIAALDRVTDRWPQDLFAMKLQQYHLFNLGRFEAMLAASAKLLPVQPENGYLLGSHAFPLELMGRLREAEEYGRRAVALERSDAWAHHAVAHVMEAEGRIDEGIAWMRAHADTWNRCNSFMLGHNWWHVALFHLDRDEPAEALAIHDAHVWGLDKSYSQDQASAASLLWRLELRGADVGERWRDVAHHVAERGIEHVQPFLDLHYVYALARGGEEALAERLCEDIAAFAEHAPVAAREAWGRVALPAARGVLAAARGRPAEAFEGLSAARDRLVEIGGSHAQRDLFEQAWLDAGLKAGAFGAVLPALEARAAARERVADPYRQLHRAYVGLGREGAAARAAERVKELSS